VAGSSGERQQYWCVIGQSLWMTRFAYSMLQVTFQQSISKHQRKD
jgi:hypothetical protein